MISRLSAIFLIAIVSTIGAGLLASLEYIKPFSLKALDLQQQWHNDADASEDRIVIVNVDQKSLDYFEQDNVSFPWPRSLYNPVIDYATKGGAKAVLFDILFNNQTNYGPAVDEEFAAAIRDSGRVILAAAFSRGRKDDHSTTPVPGSLPYQGTAPEDIRRHQASLPVEPILSSSRAIGSVSQNPDMDGVFRKIRLFTEHEGRMVPTLGLAPLLQPDSEIQWLMNGLKLDDLVIPTDRQGEALLRFNSRFEQYKLYSAVDVILSAMALEQGESPAISASWFKNAYVFIAYTAPGLFDLNPTPIHARSPGAAIHATLLTNALDGQFLVPVRLQWQWLLAFVVTFAVTGSIVSVRRTSYSGPLVLLLVIITLAVTQAGFHLNNVWDLPLLAIALISAIVSAGTYRYQTEGKQRRFIQGAFSRYVSPQIVQSIVEAPDNLKLGGDKREITLLFSDMEGFTSLTEKLSAEELIDVLNGYTTLMADTVIENSGTVDKFIGDAVMAFWGAPLDQSDQSEQAIASALEFQQSFKAMCSLQYPELSLSVRIGIDRGICILGNVGSQIRFDYTAIGDTVNQASRLESLNSFYGTRILVGEQAWQKSNNQFVGRQIDYLKVKGKDLPTLVYEAMAPLQSATAKQIDVCRKYDEAFRHYQARDWRLAEEILLELIAGYSDIPSQVLLQRVREYTNNPPEPEWDGAFKHLAK